MRGFLVDSLSFSPLIPIVFDSLTGIFSGSNPMHVLPIASHFNSSSSGLLVVSIAYLLFSSRICV